MQLITSVIFFLCDTMAFSLFTLSKLDDGFQGRFLRLRASTLQIYRVIILSLEWTHQYQLKREGGGTLKEKKTTSECEKDIDTRHSTHLASSVIIVAASSTVAGVPKLLLHEPTSRDEH